MKFTVTILISSLLSNQWVNAAVSPLKNDDFPLYTASVTAPADLAEAQALATQTLGGYQCIRYGLIYSFPQKVDTETVIIDDPADGNDIKAFYGTVGLSNGIGGTDSDCCLLAA